MSIQMICSPPAPHTKTAEHWSTVAATTKFADYAHKARRQSAIERHAAEVRAYLESGKRKAFMRGIDGKFDVPVELDGATMAQRGGTFSDYTIYFDICGSRGWCYLGDVRIATGAEPEYSSEVD